MTPKILFFNGPPRSGKDTSAIYTMNRFSTYVGRYNGNDIAFDRFAMPIKRAFAGMVCADIDRFGNCEPYESTKGDVIPWLGVSYRQWQIDFSESFLKGYGDDIFSRLFVQRNADFKGRAIVVPDSGFKCEVGPVAERFGMENVLLLRIHRPGFDFTGDSRSYLHDVCENEQDVENDGDVKAFHRKLEKIVGDFLHWS